MADEAPRKASLMTADTAYRKMTVANQDLPQTWNKAEDATNAEKNMTILQAFRTYPKAVISSMVL